MMLDIEIMTEEHIWDFCSHSEGVHKELRFALENKNIRSSWSVISPIGEIIGVLGISYISSGVWEGWFYPSTYVKKYPRSLVLASKLFSDLLVEKDMHRLQIAVLDNNKKWAEALGFQFESVVKNYHGNKDHFMYIKVRG